MSKVQHLRDQAAKAERFARQALDSLTIERLRAMAQDYQQQADQLASYFASNAETTTH